MVTESPSSDVRLTTYWASSPTQVTEAGSIAFAGTGAQLALFTGPTRAYVPSQLPGDLPAVGSLLVFDSTEVTKPTATKIDWTLSQVKALISVGSQLVALTAEHGAALVDVSDVPSVAATVAYPANVRIGPGPVVAAPAPSSPGTVVATVVRSLQSPPWPAPTVDGLLFLDVAPEAAVPLRVRGPLDIAEPPIDLLPIQGLDQLASVGSAHLDAASATGPAEAALASFELAPAVHAIIALPESIGEVRDAPQGATTVVAVPKAAANSGSPLGRVDLGERYEAYGRDGTILWLTGHEPGDLLVAQAVDLSDPRSPRLRGRLAAHLVLAHAPNEFSTIYIGGHVLVDSYSFFGDGPSVSRLSVYDLSDPDQPRFAVSLGIDALGLYAARDTLWVSTQLPADSAVPGANAQLVRIDVGLPGGARVSAGVPAPGAVVYAASDGSRVYVMEEIGEAAAALTNLHALDVTAQNARLSGTAQVSGEVMATAFTDGRAYVLSFQAPSAEAATPTGLLYAIDLATMEVTASTEVPIWGWPRRNDYTGRQSWSVAVTLAGDMLFAITEEGAFIFDVADPATLSLLRFLPTLGTVEDLVLDGTTVYLAEGEAGVEEVDPSRLRQATGAVGAASGPESH